MSSVRKSTRFDFKDEISVAQWWRQVGTSCTLAEIKNISAQQGLPTDPLVQLTDCKYRVLFYTLAGLNRDLDGPREDVESCVPCVRDLLREHARDPTLNDSRIWLTAK